MINLKFYPKKLEHSNAKAKEVFVKIYAKLRKIYGYSIMF